MRRHRLVASVRRFGDRSGRKRGQKVGPNPTDRGKSVSKRHLLTDAFGLPLTVVLTAANVHDSKVFEGLLDAVPPINPSGRGRPRKRPKKLHADKGYDSRIAGGLCTSAVFEYASPGGARILAERWGGTGG